MSGANIARNLDAVRKTVADALAKRVNKQTCTLVGVSKTKPIEDLQAAYDHHQRHFGENYIQELIQKASELPKDIFWHYIGHVQSNKAKLLVREVSNLYLIETVDSVKIANALNKASEEFRKPTNPLHILIQVNTSHEVHKNGVNSVEECVHLAQHIIALCPYLSFKGLMTIGKQGEGASDCFDELQKCRSILAEKLGLEEQQLELSMGMSSDFEKAVRSLALDV
ncbi:hypothetical protein ABG067_002695 [Albugo candida]